MLRITLACIRSAEILLRQAPAQLLMLRSESYTRSPGARLHPLSPLPSLLRSLSTPTPSSPGILPCAGRRSTHAHTHSNSCSIRSAEQVIDQIVHTNDSRLIGTEFVIWCKRDLFVTSRCTIYPATVSNHCFHTVLCKDRAAESRQGTKQSTASPPLRQETAIVYDGAFDCICNSWQ